MYGIISSDGGGGGGGGGLFVGMKKTGRGVGFLASTMKTEIHKDPPLCAYLTLLLLRVLSSSVQKSKKL